MVVIWKLKKEIKGGKMCWGRVVIVLMEDNKRVVKEIKIIDLVVFYDVELMRVGDYLVSWDEKYLVFKFCRKMIIESN